MADRSGLVMFLRSATPMGRLTESEVIECLDAIEQYEGKPVTSQPVAAELEGADPIE